MSTKLKVTFTTMEVINNGEWTGTGELYWNFLVDKHVVSSRSIADTRKTADGDVINILKSYPVTKETGQSLTIFGSAGEKDNIDKDDFASFTDNFMSPTWGVGIHAHSLIDKYLNVKVTYKIELA